MTWVGQPLKRKEDPRLLTGRGQFIDDLALPHLHHLAILRSPHAHARIKAVDATEALRVKGVKCVVTADEVVSQTNPFSAAITEPIHYYCLAVDKIRYVGEPVAAVVATDRYIAEDAAGLIRVEYDPLPAIVDQEEAMRPGAPVLHEEVGHNVANHRLLVYGDPDAAFAEADEVVTHRYCFPRYSSLPLETYGMVCSEDPSTGILTVWSNFHGPFTLHTVVAQALRLPANKLRFVIPREIGGSFGIKCVLGPYVVLTALAARKSGYPVKWIEDRQEHMLGNSGSADRVGYVEAAVQRDGTVLGLKYRWIDNNGAYIRAPEPANLYRTTGNMTGAYRVQNLELDGYAVCTNKAPSTPNRGYGCQQLYFGLERLMDHVAERLQMDPAELRLKNFIAREAFPYTTPSGGEYDAGDFHAVFQKALDLADYQGLREWQRQERQRGRLIGIGLATVVDPSVSNMGYVTVAIDPAIRKRPDYLPKSGSADYATLSLDALGQVTVVMATAPQGQGHETPIAQIVADELGLHPDQVMVVDEFDSARSIWGVSSGTYSSRFASMGASAVALAARQIKEKLLRIAGHLWGFDPGELEIVDGHVRVRKFPDQSMAIKRVAGMAHWNPGGLPPGMEPGLKAVATFTFPRLAGPDEGDRVNSSYTYSFIADVVLAEVLPETGSVRILKYVTVHDSGRVLNPLVVEGQVYGSVLHGLAGALFEEFKYDGGGQLVCANLVDYLCPTAAEAPELEIHHVQTLSPLTPLGSKGCGEGSSETAPVAIANAVADALRPFGIEINELPLTPERLWSKLASRQHFFHSGEQE